jgi:ribosomal protein S18 acetylase RimI-like enzyme
LRKARHRFINFGDEDLVSFLANGVVLLAESGGDPWGVMILQWGEMAQGAPPRVHLRCLALAPGRSPSLDIPMLGAAMEERVRDQISQGTAVQVMVYGEKWLVEPLRLAGFELVDRLQYLALDRLQRRASPPGDGRPSAQVTLRAGRPADMAAVAELDDQAFAPIWRLDKQTLMMLFLVGRVRLAEQFRRIVGYAALSIPGGRDAQLARLAVHPAAQGMGVGRLLLADAIDYARRSQSEGLLLNTQTSNSRSLALYRAFGFRPTGRVTPVLARTIAHDLRNDVDGI